MHASEACGPDLAANLALRGAQDVGHGGELIGLKRQGVDGVGNEHRHVIARVHTPWQPRPLQPTVTLLHRPDLSKEYIGEHICKIHEPNTGLTNDPVRSMPLYIMAQRLQCWY